MMRAVVLTGFGDAERFHDGHWPSAAPQSDEAFIRIRAASFNPIDIAFRQGYFGGDLPMALGRDFSGVIESVGNAVADFCVGDEVYGYLPGPKSNGSYAECVTVSTDFIARKPQSVSFVEAAAIPVVGLTAYHCVRKARIRPGRSVLVAGAAGGVGSMAIQLLQDCGAAPIIATAGSDASESFLTQTLKISPEAILRHRGLSPPQLVERATTLNGGEPISAAFDFAGGDMKRLCFEVVAPEGDVVSIVEEPPDFPLNLWDERTSPLILKSVSFHFEQLAAQALLGAKETWRTYRRDLETLTGLIEAGRIAAPHTVVVGDLAADTVRRAHVRLESGGVQGKLVMRIGASES